MKLKYKTADEIKAIEQGNIMISIKEKNLVIRRLIENLRDQPFADFDYRIQCRSKIDGIADRFIQYAKKHGVSVIFDGNALTIKP